MIAPIATDLPTLLSRDGCDSLETEQKIGGSAVSSFLGGGMIGADPDQLAALGQTLSRQRSDIEQLVATVTSALATTTWSGPARQAFEQDWQSSFRTTLSRLGEAFDLVGRDCLQRANELRRVMGAP